MDKYSFTLGVLGISLTQYVMLLHGQLFKYYYCAIMLPLLVLRIYLYHQYKWQYFLLDFCYFVNVLGTFAEREGRKQTQTKSLKE